MRSAEGATVSKATQNLDRSLAIDIMRGLAALGVLAYHARGMLWMGTATTWKDHRLTLDPSVLLRYVALPFSLGDLGVGLFFVLSGYCIHIGNARSLQAAALADTQPPALDTGRFLRRRFVRLYPTYLAALLLAVVLDLLATKQVPTLLALGTEQGKAFWGSVFFLEGIATPFYPNTVPFWTLVLEVHFYLAYPLLLGMSRRWGAWYCLKVTFFVALGTILFFRMVAPESLFPYWNTGGCVFLKYWFSWAIGLFVAEMAVGRVETPQVLRNLWWVVFGVISLGLRVANQKDFSDLGFAIFFAGLVWNMLNGTLHFARMPKSAVWCLGKVGLFSYSLYATHVAVLSALRAWWNPLHQPQPSPVFFLAGLVVAILVAYAMFWLVESRTLVASQKLRGR